MSGEWSVVSGLVLAKSFADASQFDCILLVLILFNSNPLAMFLNLSHTKMDVYQTSQMLALECYRITKQFPDDEKYSMTRQLRRAALSVHLNLAEGCSRKSNAERKRFFEISRGSVIEIDACLDLVVKLNYAPLQNLKPIGELIVKVFQMLSKMIRSGEESTTTNEL